MSPPLRVDKSTPDHLLNLIGAGQIQVVGSDHCVFTSAQKAAGEKDFRKIPNGVNGIEER
jgi:dihydropyrimidinase